MKHRQPPTDEGLGEPKKQFNNTFSAEDLVLEQLTGRNPTRPNLQNIPVRTEEGRLIREAFLHSREK